MGVNGNRILNSKETVAQFVSRLITVVFYISVFFPFFQTLPVDSDTQPHALILSILISLMCLPDYKR